MSCSWSPKHLSRLFLTKFRTIEANLNSISRAPRIQRQEMLKYVHQPILCRIDYRRAGAIEDICDGCSLQGLISVCEIAGTQQDLHGFKLRAERESYFKLDQEGLQSILIFEYSSTEITKMKVRDAVCISVDKEIFRRRSHCSISFL